MWKLLIYLLGVHKKDYTKAVEIKKIPYIIRIEKYKSFADVILKGNMILRGNTNGQKPEKAQEERMKNMSSDEILRQQLELLAEKSKKTKSVRKLEKLTNAMVRISRLFYP